MSPLVPLLCFIAACCLVGLWWAHRDYRNSPVWLALVGAMLLLVLVPVTMFCPGISYSDGTRVGFVAKLSKAGFLFPTWEGEMQMGGIVADAGGSVSAAPWRFSVRSELVAQQMLAAMHDGKRLEVHYQQLALRGCALGSTTYDVTRIE